MKHTTQKQLKESGRRSRERTAQRHANADKACHREWICACATCRMVRKTEWQPGGKQSAANGEAKREAVSFATLRFEHRQLLDKAARLWSLRRKVESAAVTEHADAMLMKVCDEVAP